jgi:hypothetical protein
MCPPAIVAIGFAVAAAATAIAAAVAQGNLDKAKQLREEVRNQYGDDILPKLDKLLVNKVPDTALSKIQEDPKLRQTQTDAIRRFGDIYSTAGTTPQDEAAYTLANEGATAAGASQQANIESTLAARGQNNNPALMAALRAQTGAGVASGVARNRLQVAADGRTRAVDALKEQASLAGAVRNTDFTQAAAKATAQDEINRFNANAATQANIENNRREMDAYQARMGLANARANATENLARGEENQAASTRAVGAGIANSASSASGAMAGYAGGGGGGGGGGGAASTMQNAAAAGQPQSVDPYLAKNPYLSSRYQ